MLHYHFGGRDGLVAAIVETMEADQRDLLGEMATPATGPEDVIRTQWQVLT
jgi:AcrR family transcriptional regulator